MTINETFLLRFASEGEGAVVGAVDKVSRASRFLDDGLQDAAESGMKLAEEIEKLQKRAQFDRMRASSKQYAATLREAAAATAQLKSAQKALVPISQQIANEIARMNERALFERAKLSSAEYRAALINLKSAQADARKVIADSVPQVRALAVEVVNLDDKAQESTSVFAKLKETIDGGLGGALSNVSPKMAIGATAIAAMAMAAVKAAQKLWELAQSGQAAADIGAAFDRMGGGAEDLRALGDAAKGALDDTTLQQVFNYGKHVGLTRDQMVRATQAYTVFHKNTTGKKIDADGLQQFIKGLSKSEEEALAIVPSMKMAGQAQQAYADQLGKSVASLSSTEKAQASLNDFMRASTGVVSEHSQIATSATDAASASLGNLIGNFEVSINAALNESGAMGMFASAVKGLDGAMQSLAPVVRLVGSVLSAVGQTLRLVGTVLSPVIDLALGLATAIGGGLAGALEVTAQFLGLVTDGLQVMGEALASAIMGDEPKVIDTVAASFNAMKKAAAEAAPATRTLGDEIFAVSMKAAGLDDIIKQQKKTWEDYVANIEGARSKSQQLIATITGMDKIKNPLIVDPAEAADVLDFLDLTIDSQHNAEKAAQEVYDALLAQSGSTEEAAKQAAQLADMMTDVTALQEEYRDRIKGATDEQKEQIAKFGEAGWLVRQLNAELVTAAEKTDKQGNATLEAAAAADILAQKEVALRTLMADTNLAAEGRVAALRKIAEAAGAGPKKKRGGGGSGRRDAIAAAIRRDELDAMAEMERAIAKVNDARDKELRKVGKHAEARAAIERHAVREIEQIRMDAAEEAEKHRREMAKKAIDAREKAAKARAKAEEEVNKRAEALMAERMGDQERAIAAARAQYAADMELFKGHAEGRMLAEQSLQSALTDIQRQSAEERAKEDAARREAEAAQFAEAFATAQALSQEFVALQQNFEEASFSSANSITTYLGSVAVAANGTMAALDEYNRLQALVAKGSLSQASAIQASVGVGIAASADAVGAYVKDERAKAGIAAVREAALAWSTAFINPAESVAHGVAAGLFGSIALGAAGNVRPPKGSGKEKGKEDRSARQSTELSRSSGGGGGQRQPLVVNQNFFSVLDSRDRGAQIIEAMNATTRAGTGAKLSPAIVGGSGMEGRL